MKNNEILAIKEQWRTYYGEKIPIAYHLRESDTDFWLRIHSLPESKRYAQNKDEICEVLRRYNAVGDAILGEGTECVLFYPDYGAKFVKSIGGFSGEPFEVCEAPELTMYAGRTKWQEGKFDSILRKIADDRIRYVSFSCSKKREIFAPYDGGADLFLSSEARRDELKIKFADWLSKHPQGF